ncbi:hypothetical protein BJP43_01025 [Candidatus Williamhamiltonella defendens]|uniref:Uncharacterized protein n=1 Tax=Candidatus Williamhamiltonella defendens TaxID=138072 RepID=A0A2D3TBC8_9ENTR|nr:hypothetical protein BJP43_01025 [Candidatus Hamiltonella defensa]
MKGNTLHIKTAAKKSSKMAGYHFLTIIIFDKTPPLLKFYSYIFQKIRRESNSSRCLCFYISLFIHH